MKHTLLTRLIVGAYAGLAAAGAYAGQIQSSSVSIAREVITDDTQQVTAPNVAYRFAGDVDARVQTQTFQVQIELGGAAEWSSVGNAASITLTDGVDATQWTQNAVAGAQTYQVLTISKSADNKTLFATIQVDQFGGKSVLKQPIVSFNSSATASDNATIVKLKTLVGDITECDVSVKNLGVTIRHFNGLTAPATLATDSNATPDEHLRQSATNTGTVITFPTNIKVTVTSATGNAKVNVASGNLAFAGTLGSSWISATLANLGAYTLVQNATGYDSNLLSQYLLTGNPALSGLTEAAAATLQNGNVEALNFTAAVSATQGFVVGGSLFLSTTANCAAAITGTTTAITAGNAAGPITLTIPTAEMNDSFGTAGTGPVYTCYDVTGVAVPIPLSAFAAVATLNKAPGALPFPEQKNWCSGNLYSLGGGVKIDVRNYANSADPNGWLSVIRLINNNETRTIDVWGQLIHADGTYGPWGKLTDLAPRAVLNLTASQVDALLVNAPAHATAANNGSATPVANATGARLRITSQAGTSLRVQNYLYNPASQNFIEASSTQAVDFEGTIDRAPSNEGQYHSQDAEAGLNGK